jgi:3-oxoadipate enol-lactonase
MPVLTSGALSLAYEVEGDGEPIVMVAGLASDRRSWCGFDRLLARAMRVITFDNRGVGETTGPVSPYSIAALADDVIGLLDGLRIERCHVLGVSMGGMAALDLAIRYPERL